MIKVAAVRPSDRAAAVEHWRSVLDYQNQPKITAWGLQVSAKPLGDIIGDTDPKHSYRSTERCSRWMPGFYHLLKSYMPTAKVPK